MKAVRLVLPLIAVKNVILVIVLCILRNVIIYYQIIFISALGTCSTSCPEGTYDLAQN